MKYAASTNGFYDEAIHGDGIPLDAIDISDEEYVALLDGQSQGKRIVAGADGCPELADQPAPTFDQIKNNLVNAVQAHMDSTAKLYGYDNLLSAVSYADEAAVPAFQAEGQAFRSWRSLVWAQCHQVLAEVQANTRAVPSVDELIGLLPGVML